MKKVFRIAASPDGRLVAIVARPITRLNKTDSSVPKEFDNSAPSARLQVLRFDDGQLNSLHTIDVGPEPGDLAWSVNSRWLSFVRDHSIRLFESATRPPHQVVAFDTHEGSETVVSAGLWVKGIAFKPDAAALVLIAHDGTYGGATQNACWLVPLEGDAPDRLTDHDIHVRTLWAHRHTARQPRPNRRGPWRADHYPNIPRRANPPRRVPHSERRSDRPQPRSP